MGGVERLKPKVMAQLPNGRREAVLGVEVGKELQYLLLLGGEIVHASPFKDRLVGICFCTKLAPDRENTYNPV